MSLTTGDLIERAQLIAHPYGMFKEQISVTQLLAFLNNLDEEISREVHQIMPSLLSTQAADVTLSASGNADGYDLEPALGYTQFIHKKESDGKEDEVHIIMESNFVHPSKHPSAIIVPSSTPDHYLLLPTDEKKKGWDDATTETRCYWQDGDILKYRYIPALSRFTTLTDELRSPDFTSNYIVQSMATLLLQMGEAPVEQVETSLVRERSYASGWRMQLYKRAKIHTPDHDLDSGLNSYVATNVIYR